MLRLGRLFILFMVVAFHVQAQDVTLSEEQKALAEQVQKYLNNLKTLQGGFAQITSTGAYSDGKVYLSRPGKMRLAYNPPLQAEIIVRDGSIIYHDKEFRQVTYYPLDATPLAVLLKDELSFHTDVRLMEVSHRTGVIEVTLEDREDAGMGSVTLVFSDSPLALRKWSVTDAQGIVTTVALLNPVVGQQVNPDNFKFVDPQYNKQDNH